METLFKIIIISYLIYIYVRETYIYTYKINPSDYKIGNLLKTLKGGQ